MMRYLLLFLLIAPLFLAGQDDPSLAATAIPSNLLENAHAVIRDREIKFSVKSAGEASFWERRVVTLISEKSSYDQLVVHYSDFNKLKRIRGKIYDGAGRFVREVEKSEITDESAISSFSIYEDDRVQRVDVNYHEYPYTVAFEYEMLYKDLLDYPDWFVARFFTSVQQSSYTILLPEGLNVETRALNLHVTPEETKEWKLRRLSWRVENLPAVVSEAHTPPVTELLPILLVSPHTFEARSYTGSMASWEDFGRFMNKLMKGRDELSPVMKEKVHTLTANAGSDEEKIRILYRYLQENMRYVSVQLGIGGWQPFSAQYVEERKYGDCKALSNFMMAMLKEVDIVSYPVLIYGGDLFYEITEDFATPRFNHMILYVPEQDCWLECTSNIDPPGYLGDWTSGRNVILITEEGGKIARTPEPAPADNSVENKVRIILDANGAANVNVVFVLRGSRQDWHRYAAKELSAEEMENTFRRFNSLTSSSHSCSSPYVGISRKFFSFCPNPAIYLIQ